MTEHGEQARDGGLFQSQEWRDFQAACGKKVWSLAEMSGTQQVLSFGLGSYGYAPRFPGVNADTATLENLRTFGQSAGWVFVRIEPQTDALLESCRQDLGTRLQKSPSDVQPREILMVNVAKEEEVLLAEMKQKTRYNIRVAQKHGVVVEATVTDSDRETFLDLLTQTAERKEIQFHPREYYQKFLEYFDERQCELLVAKKDTVILAGLLLVYYQGTAYYLHGGSGDAGRKYMAPHLLQWEAMKRARARGCQQYDFGGVAIESLAPTGKDWSGITRFKQGFAPHTKTTLFPGAYDIIIDSRRYFLYRTLRRIKNIFS